MKEDDTTIYFELDPTAPPTTDWADFDQMTAEARRAAALADPDAQPATEAQLAQAQRAPNVRTLRHKLNLTQEQFARTFQLSLHAIQEWEQSRSHPDMRLVHSCASLSSIQHWCGKPLLQLQTSNRSFYHAHPPELYPRSSKTPS